MASEGFEAISLQSILDNDEAAIKAVNQAWTDRGYCWVDLRTLEKEESAATEKALKRLVAIRKWTARSAIKDLDNLADSDNVRVLQRGKAFGIVRAGHKTSFRILTGPLAKHFPGPKALGEHVQQLAKLTDEIMRRLIERFALPIFGAEDAQAFCDAHELPLGVRGGYHEEDRAGSPKRARFGMLDLALYHNVPADDKKKGAFRARSGYLTENDLNCADHHDPGLFTLSFLSTAPGLELYDWSRQRWEAAPSGPESHFAILWTGGAAVDATSGRLRPGRHRVTFEQAAGPRLAIWHEVCTLGQVHLDTDIAEMDKKLDGEGLFLPNVGESGILLTKEPLVPMATSHSAPERLFGLPISKVLRPKPLSPFKAEPELGVAISKVPAPATSWEAITAAFQAKERLFIIWLLPRILHTALLEPLLQPRVISEIISGIILGPSCLGQIHNFTNYLFPSRSLPYLQALGSFSVILFLFMTGCHLKPDQMWRQRYKAILSSFTAIGLTLCVAPGLAKLFEDPEYTHFNYTQLILLMAILLSIPAEAVMARILGERGLLGTKLGSLSMGTDSLGLVICFLLLSALLSLYAEDHPCTTPTNLCAGTVYVCPNDSASIMDPLWVFLVFVGFVIFLLTVCRFLFSILAVRAQQKGRTESFLFLAALAINIACAWFTQTLGLSSLIGPILLGLMAVPRTGSLAQDLEAQLGPVTTTLLLPIFFALVGLKTDFTLLTTGDIGLAFVLLGALWGTTFVGAFAAACLVSREFTWHNLYFGTLLTCKGLTALTIFNILSAVGTITNRFYALVVLYAIISCAIVSPLIWFCQQIEARGKLARRRADPNFKEELRIFVLPRAGYLAPACATVAAWIAQHFDLPDAHILFARFLDDFDAIEQFIPLLQKPIPAPILANDGIFGPAQVRWNGMHPPGVTTYKAAVAPNLQEAYLRLASGDKSTNFHPYDFQIVGYDHTEGCWNIVQAAVQKQRARVFVVAGKPLMTLAGAHNALVLRNPAVGNSLFLTSLFQAQASTMSLTYWQPNDEFGRPIELMECTTPLQVLQTIAALDTPPASITAVFCPIPRSREEFRNLLNAANECHIPVVFESSAELPLQFSTASLGAMRTPLPRDDDDNDGDDGDNNDGSSEEPEGTPHRADRVVIVDGTDEV